MGLGVHAPVASLGALINDGYKSFLMHPYMLVFPAMVTAPSEMPLERAVLM